MRPTHPFFPSFFYYAANRLATHDSDVVQFDADGNMTKWPLSGELVDFAFDSRNRLTQAGSMVYRYDAENQRIGVNQTQFVVNSQPALSQVLVKEENGAKTFYVYGLGLIGEETGSQYTSYHFDLRGSTVALTNSTAQVTERFQYSPYGALLSGDATKTPFLFNGMYGVMTDSNGLYYMRARFYSPEMRRFVNQDILLGFVEDGQTLNRYAYVTGRPVSFVDPFGLESTEVEKQSCSPLFFGPSYFPDIPNVGACGYYDRIASENGCNYHSYAAGICRGEPNPWSWAANLLLQICGSFGDSSVTQVKNCVRTCLVAYDHYVRENDSACQLHTDAGICTQLKCIDAYHHQCFENCGVSWRCYGGNFDNFIPPNWFYDE